MRVKAMSAALLLSACSGGTAVTTTTTSEAPLAAAPPVATTSSSTTSSTVVTTTTTTIASLDRTAAATAIRLQADLDELTAHGPRVSGTASEAAALEWFRNTAESITGVVPALRTVPLPNGTESGNVWVGPIGTGSDVLLLGAHIDSIATSPGVDDNGSGVVILLELLRRLAEQPPVGIQVVVVAFGAEEYVPGFDHHYGSTTAADEMEAAGTLPVFMMSVDMVGMGDTLHSTPYAGSDRSFAEGLVGLAADVGIDLVLRPRGDISDHVPFARAGVPSVLLLRGDNPGYHTPADDHVEIDGVIEALAVVEALVASLGD